MKVSALTSTLVVALAAITSAAPQGPAEDPSIPTTQVASETTQAQSSTQQAIKKALVCTRPNASGDCKILTRPPGQCGEFQNPFDNSISYVLPYKGFKCTFWT